MSLAARASSSVRTLSERSADALARLYPYRPRPHDRRFWGIQVLLAAIAAVHFALESQRLLEQAEAHIHSLFLLPISLFFVPVVYAALSFGLPGAVATAAWATILAIPNLVLFHDPPEQLGELVQIAMVDAVAVLAGGRVERELRLRRRAEAASAALQSYAARVVRAQEAERKRIAQELHDETVQKVVAVCRQLDTAEAAALPETARSAIHDARGTSEAIVAELRDFARALRPPALEDLGLVSALRRITTELAERARVSVALEVSGDERRLQPDVELALFRIAQEALRNGEHHARASHVRVAIAFDPSTVRVEVSDDGVGIHARSAQDFAAGGSLGLLGMRERAEMAGGTLEVRSSPHAGTNVIATVRSTITAALD